MQSLAQFVFNKCISNLSKDKSGITFKIYFTLRQVLVKLLNPDIKYSFYNFEITLPLSHDLPFNKTAIPGYSDNLGQIVKLLYEETGPLKIIDVGANVGDTVCIIKNYSDASILSIEGNVNFIGLLEKNTKQFSGVKIYNSFVGEPKSAKLKLNTQLGSANISLDSIEGTNIDLQTLDEILIKESEFANAQLLKIDTDGFDNTIIRSAKQFITGSQPVIFFEYDPYFLNKINENGLSIFDFLEDLGYTEMILFDNVGNYYSTANSKDKDTLKKLHAIAENKEGLEYYDICIYTNKYKSTFLPITLK